jgi:hypothetical protein
MLVMLRDAILVGGLLDDPGKACKTSLRHRRGLP